MLLSLFLQGGQITISLDFDLRPQVIYHTCSYEFEIEISGENYVFMLSFFMKYGPLSISR